MITERIIRLHMVKKKVYLTNKGIMAAPFFKKSFYNLSRKNSINFTGKISYDKFYTGDHLMSEMLIRNKRIFSYQGINMDRLLSFCRFYEDESNFYIDGWTINKRNKEIFYHNKKPEQNFVQNDYQKLLAAKNLLYLYNETPDELINWANYHDLGQWYDTNKELIIESTLCNEYI